MPIILSQRIDVESQYDDVPYARYHFPRKYRGQVKVGDRFVYYQGDRHRRDRRCYFGCGVIGQITADDSEQTFVAEILDGHPFRTRVSTYAPDGSFYESLGYETVRKTPPWQWSIRPMSPEAFATVLRLGGVEADHGVNTHEIESAGDALKVLQMLNDRYANAPPEERQRKLEQHLDRGVAVTAALKRILGGSCQICGWQGFVQRNGTPYIEAHHVQEIASRAAGSLCTDNILLLCPNCHRRVHHDPTVVISTTESSIRVRTDGTILTIPKNSMSFLLEQLLHHATQT